MPYGTFPMTMNETGERGDERNGRNIVENREKAGRSRVYKGHKRKGESRVSSLEVVYDYDSPLHISGLAKLLWAREKAAVRRATTISRACDGHVCVIGNHLHTILLSVSVKALETTVRDLTRL